MAKKRRKMMMTPERFRVLFGRALSRSMEMCLRADHPMDPEALQVMAVTSLVPALEGANLYPTTLWGSEYGDVIKDEVRAWLHMMSYPMSGDEDATELRLDEPFEGYATGLEWAAHTLVLNDLTRPEWMPQHDSGSEVSRASHVMFLVGQLIFFVSVAVELACSLVYPGVRRQVPGLKEEALHFLTCCQARFMASPQLLLSLSDDPLVRLACTMNMPIESMGDVDGATERSLIKTITGLMDTGNNAFCFDAETTEVFKQTDVMGLPLEDIKMPYSSFQIHTPDDEVFFSCYDLPDGASIWQVHVFDKSCVTLRWLPEYKTLGDAWEALIPIYGQMNLDEEVSEPALRAMHLIVNLALYLTTTSPVVKTKGRVSRKASRGAGPSRRKGREELVTLTSLKRSVEPVVAYASGVNRGTPNAHWVRGHWRAQPVGKRGSGQTKRIWIQPYLRGEGDLPETRKYTDVKEA